MLKKDKLIGMISTQMCSNLYHRKSTGYVRKPDINYTLILVSAEKFTLSNHDKKYL